MFYSSGEMKPLPLLVLGAALLSSCVPAVEQSINTASTTRPFTSSCAQVLTALENVAVQTRPFVYSGNNTWSSLDIVGRDPLKRTFSSRNTSSFGSSNLNMGPSVDEKIEVVATCVEAKGTTLLTLTSKGQIRPLLDQLHDALYKGVRLP